MLDPQKTKELIKFGENELVEFKISIPKDEEIRNSIIAFANDYNDNKEGYIIFGVSNDGKIIGLEGDLDNHQRKISNIARIQCQPQIPISISVININKKSLIIVEVRQSAKRPHFKDCYIRIGSTNRRADENEIEDLRKRFDPKYYQIWKWINDNKTTITVELERGRGFHNYIIENIDGQLLSIRGIKNSVLRTIPLEDIKLSYDHQSSRPKLIIDDRYF